MAARKKARRTPPDPLESYRRIRKPMPPPERVIPDKRRKLERRREERELRERGEESGAEP